MADALLHMNSWKAPTLDTPLPIIVKPLVTKKITKLLKATIPEKKDEGRSQKNKEKNQKIEETNKKNDKTSQKNEKKSEKKKIEKVEPFIELDDDGDTKCNDSFINDLSRQCFYFADLVFHQDVVSKLKKFLDDNQNGKKTPPFLIVSGSAGSGKMYCVKKAAQLAGMEVQVVDLLSEEGPCQTLRQALCTSQMVSSSSSSSSQNIRVICINAAEGYDASVLKKAKTIIEQLLMTKKTKKSKKTLNFQTNALIFTCNNRYDKTLASFLRSLQFEAKNEVKCKPLISSEINQIISRLCLMNKQIMNKTVKTIISQSNGNMNALLSTLQFDFASSDPSDNKSNLGSGFNAVKSNSVSQVDLHPIDLFKTAQTLLSPKDMDMISYQKTWLGFGDQDKLFDVIHQSYPSFIAYVSIPENSEDSVTKAPDDHVTFQDFLNKMQDWKRKRTSGMMRNDMNGFMPWQGLEDAQQIADAYSLNDVFLYEGLNGSDNDTYDRQTHEFTTVLMMTLQQRLVGANVRSGSTVNIKTNWIQDYRGDFGYCLIDRRKEENFRYLVEINRLEQEKLLKIGPDYKINTEYALDKHIGQYEGRLNDGSYLLMSVFDIEDEVKRKKGTKRKMGDIKIKENQDNLKNEEKHDEDKDNGLENNGSLDDVTVNNATIKHIIDSIGHRYTKMPTRTDLATQIEAELNTKYNLSRKIILINDLSHRNH